MRAVFVALMLAALTLAGCTDADPDPGSDADAADAGDDVIDEVLNETIPMVPAPPDLWEDATDIVLFDGAITIESDEDSASAPCTSAFAAWPCLRLDGFGSGNLILPGTGTLYVEVDASQAQGSGDLYATVEETALRTKHQVDEFYAEPSPPPARWEFALEAIDWDSTEADASAAVIGIWPNEVGTNWQGDLAITVGIQRDPAWSPEPTVDTWAGLPGRIGYHGLHVLDTNVTGAVYGGYDASQRQQGPSVALDAPIRTDVKFVLVGIGYDTFGGCEPQGECYFDAEPFVNGTPLGNAHRLIQWDAQSTVLLFDTPDGFPQEPENATTTNRTMRVMPRQCDPAFEGYAQYSDSERSCVYMLDEGRGDLRIRVEQWRDAPNLDAFRERLGAA